MKTIPFNLNNRIRLKLTEFGYEVWKAEHESLLPECFHNPLSYYKALTDKEGYVPFQCWKAMEMFGPYLYPSAREVLADMNALIDADPT